MPRRFLRLFVIYSGVALLTVTVGLLGLILYGSRDRETNFYVTNADLNDRSYLDKLEQDLQKSDSTQEETGFGFSAHRLRAGRGVVLAYRHYSGGNAFNIDDEVYDKLTIWLRDPLPLATKQTLSIPNQGVAVFSSGGSAWPRNDCSGYVTGAVNVTPFGSGIDVRVDGRFEPRGNRDTGDECPSRSVTLQFQAKQARFDELNPWQGGIGATHPYDETYAP